MEVRAEETSYHLTGNEAFAFFVDDGDEARYRVCYDCKLELWEEVELLTKSHCEEMGCYYLFGRKGDCLQLAMYSDSDGSLLVGMQHKIGSALVTATTCHDFPSFRYSLWSAYGMMAAAEGIALIHSSSVVVDGKAYLFLGESGTGKSTHSRLWLKAIPGTEPLNDDSPVIRTGNGVAMAYGSPWSGKSPCYVPKSFPIAAIVRLSQASQNRIRPLDRLQAFAAIYPSLSPMLAQCDYYSDFFTELTSAIIGCVPVYHLECLPDQEAAMVCYSAVKEGFGGMESRGE